jgi:hypothetical protein
VSSAATTIDWSSSRTCFDWRRGHAAGGFGGRLHQAAEEMNREIGVRKIRADVQGDGSLFPARRGFDPDLPGYRRTPARAGLSDDRS